MSDSEITYDEFSSIFPPIKLAFGALNRHRRFLDWIRGSIEYQAARRRYRNSEIVTPLDGWKRYGKWRLIWHGGVITLCLRNEEVRLVESKANVYWAGASGELITHT